MKSYSVWFKENGEWYRDTRGVNKLYAECVRDYYLDRGIRAEVREEDQNDF